MVAHICNQVLGQRECVSQNHAIHKAYSSASLAQLMSSKFHERQTEEEDISYLPLTCTWHEHMTQTYKNIKFTILLFILFLLVLFNY